MLEVIHRYHAKIKKILELEHYRRNIIKINKDSSDEEIQEIVSYLKKEKAGFFCYSFSAAYDSYQEEIFLDTECGMSYLMRNDKRLYFPEQWKKEQIINYYRTLMAEQDEKSPHRYLTPELESRTYNTVIDIGAAEGIFALDMLEKAKRIVIFEADDKWLRPLEKTFEQYKEKVQIIPKFVSDFVDSEYTTLDKEFGTEIGIDLIKMDVEGAEVNAIRGAKAVLEANLEVVILACAYHYATEENEIREILSAYNVIPRHGYVLYHWPVGEMLQRPYLRRAVLEARKNR